MYVLSGQSMQKWLLSKSQGDKLVSEIDVRRALVTNLLSSLDSQASDLTLRIEDADYTRDDQIAFLVGFSELNRIYNYSVIVGRESNGILAIDPLSGCDLKLSQQANHVSALSLSLSNGGPFFFVNSDNQVVISTLQSGVDFEETLPFTHAQSGIIGLSVDKPRPASQDADTAISAVVAFLGSSQNLVQVNVSAAAVSDDVDMTRLISTGQVTEQSKERATQMLRTKLEQAVFFGSSNGAERSNPIAFDLAQPGGDIDAAAVQVSESILTSTSQHIQPFLDQGAHLTERFHRIDRVVSFISTHGLLSKLSHAARLKLSFNAEKIVAAQALWRFLNAVRGQPEAVKRNKALLLLEDSIGRFMTGQLSQEDPVKDFFENKVIIV
nr:hypothetical protein HK105_007156 [Polyrhizophydium stewartii]